MILYFSFHISAESKVFSSKQRRTTSKKQTQGKEKKAKSSSENYFFHFWTYISFSPLSIERDHFSKIELEIWFIRWSSACVFTSLYWEVDREKDYTILSIDKNSFASENADDRRYQRFIFDNYLNWTSVQNLHCMSQKYIITSIEVSYLLSVDLKATHFVNLLKKKEKSLYIYSTIIRYRVSPICAANLIQDT